MKCPFCHYKLTTSDSKTYTSYYCNHDACLINNDMPRFIIHYYNESYEPLSKTFYADGLYVQIDFNKNTTTISKLDVVILFNTVVIPKAIDFDLTDMSRTLKKLKTMVTFS